MCSQVVESYKAYGLLKGKATPAPASAATGSKFQHSKGHESPHPVPPVRRRSSFLQLLLSPSRCPAIHEEDSPSSPHTPHSISPPLSSYATPKLNIFPCKASLFPSIKELPTSTPKDEVDHQESSTSHDEKMVTAEDFDMDLGGSTSSSGQPFLGDIPVPFLLDSAADAAQVADDPMVLDQEEASAALVLSLLVCQGTFPCLTSMGGNACSANGQSYLLPAKSGCFF